MKYQIVLLVIIAGLLAFLCVRPQPGRYFLKQMDPQLVVFDTATGKTHLVINQEWQTIEPQRT